MAGKKSLMLHAIKTNHFPECTWILEKIWARLRAGLDGIHFTDASFRDCAIMRGWSINHEGVFGFTSTHDLCDAWFTRKGMEAIVKRMYENELESRIYDHPKVWAGTTLEDYIWEICKYR
jgi:hypothetical protein